MTAGARLQAVLQTLRGNKLFEWGTVGVILLSSVSVGAKTYTIAPGADVVLALLDTAVSVYFVVEILVRLFAEPRMRDFFRSGWNIFDALIVTVSLIPLDDSETVLLARLLRLFRVMRLIVFIPQLRALVSALLSALPRIGYVALMMFVIFYIYAVLGSLLFSPINPTLWSNIGIAMITLFRVATLEDWTDVMYETMEVYPLSWMFYLSFIFLNAFVFLNMMIGVIIQVMHEEQETVTPRPKYLRGRSLWLR